MIDSTPPEASRLIPRSLPGAGLVRRLPALSLLPLAALLAVGPAHRFGALHYKTAIAVMAGAGLAGAGMCLLALLGWLAAPGFGASRPGLLIAALIGGLCSGVPARQYLVARSLPPIHDISTDLDAPPAFRAVLGRRGPDANSVEHGGAELAGKQRSAYPDLSPYSSATAPGPMVALAAKVLREQGLEMVAVDPEAGRVEATATTFWFGYQDDLVVRVRPVEGGGSRLDVRSLSRVGVSDLGANAARIRRFLARLAELDPGATRDL